MKRQQRVLHFAHQKADFHCESEYLPRGITKFGMATLDTGSPGTNIMDPTAPPNLRRL